MSKAIKLKNNLYLDSTSIVHNKRKLSDIFYPIGSVYISVNDVNPATLYGGTWQKVSGYYLLAWDQEYGKTGGKWYTNDTILSVEQMPNHYHWVIGDGRNAHVTLGDSTWGWSNGVIPNSANTAGTHVRTDNVGGSKGHNHYFETPWFKVNVWYRTA